MRDATTMRERIGCDGGMLRFNPSTPEFVRTPPGREGETAGKADAEEALVGPEVLFVQVTSQCNANCRYCYEASGRPRGKPLTRDELLELMRRAREMEVVLVKLTGGEPLLSPDIYDIIGEVRSLEMGVWLYTNGTLLTRTVLSALCDHGLSHLQMNIDAGHAIETAEGLLRLKRRLGDILDAGLEVNLSYAVCDENVDHLARIDEVLAAFPPIAVCICPVFAPPCQCVGVTSGPSERVLEEVRRFWMRWSDRWTRKTALAMSQEEALGICGAGSSMVYVGVDGIVSPCPVMTTAECVAGNIRNAPLGTIWREAHIFRSLRAARVADIPGCATCMFRSTCRGGCRMRAYAASGRFLAEDPLSCRFYASLLDSDVPPESIGYL